MTDDASSSAASSGSTVRGTPESPTPVRTLAVKSADGVQSELPVFGAGLADTAPVVVIMPAMGVGGRYYHRLAPAFSARGYRVATADLRGHGSSSVRPSFATDFGYRELLHQDWPAVLGAVKDAFPGAPLFLLGHSLGGQLSLLYGASYPNSVRGVATVAACSVYWRVFEKRRRTLVGTQLFRVLGEILGQVPGDKIGFAGREARGVARDWSRQARTGRYLVSGDPTDHEHRLAITETPALIVSLAGDDDMAPREAVDHLSDKVSEAVRTRIHLEDPAILATPRPHFHWVQHPGAFVDAFVAWAGPLAA